MNRREMIRALGVTAAAVGATRSAQAADEHEGHAAHFMVCAKACAECQLDCHACQRHCAMLVAEGKKDHVKTMRLCADCGDICALAANIVARQGALSATICRACAEACDTCGAACAVHDHDEHMKKCAEACAACAKACREMLKHMPTDK